MGQRFIRGALAPHPDDAIDGITYDCGGRMQYHPDFHFSHGKPFSQDDLEYLCTFYGIDDARTISFALGKTEHVCRVKYASLKKAGLLEYYRNSYKRKLEAN
ncbi:DNA-entry nuclease [Paenibacillus sp. HN-1]|uniref:DNA-entry nuclease n=1 Tax=Paenibacillus TaxID=44249 RepID=UPI001CA8A66C|nr:MULTISPECIES: DNA-entry nuclease [Paenibacillus]MBY9078280.1 DNA-entry nuclease [Paenibacillus sp. CGMCC 1.18879]MBY9086061.1 DNA-entry nuclease [Paenibacillus sinensis]